METVLANEVGKVRRATLNGRKYVVAPLSLLAPGVLAGSQGPIYYPPDLVTRDPMAWNHMPIVVKHPVQNDAHVSARSPVVLESQGVGFVFHASADGKLAGEAWLDEENTNRVDARIIPWLEAGRPVEVSTGLFLDTVPAPEGATHNGKPYQFIATGMRPDHLAILPDEVGACSNADGCGLNVNAEDRGLFRKFFDWLKGGGQVPTGNAWSEAAREAAAESRRAHGHGGEEKGGHGGEVPKTGHPAIDSAVAAAKTPAEKAGAIHESAKHFADLQAAGHGDANALIVKAMGAALSGASVDDLKAAAKAVGLITREAKPEKLKAQIVQRTIDRAGGNLRAALIDRTGPQEAAARLKQAGFAGNTDTTRNRGTADMDKKALVSWLTANCDCWKGSEAVLNGMGEDALKRIKADADKVRTLDVIVANARAARRAVANADGAVADGEVAPGINIGDLAKFLGVETDPGQDPAGFIRDILAKLDEIEQRLGDEPEPPESPDDATPADVAPTAMSATPAGNRRGGRRSLREWEASMPDEARAVWNTAKEIEQAERRRLVQQIVANGDYASEQERKADFAELMREPIGSLRKQIRRLGRQAREQPEPVANYLGASGVADAPAQTEEDARDYLPVPTVNYAELADARK